MHISRSTVRAFLEAQIALSKLPLAAADLSEATDAALRYLEHVPELARTGVWLVLERIELAARTHHLKSFPALSVDERRKLLIGLESAPLDPLASVYPDLVSVLALLGWLVIYSSPAARAAIGFSVPQGTVEPGDWTPPPRPNLDQRFRVCVIGSGAGGAVVASRLADGGGVLVVEAGDWLGPGEFPVRDDDALVRLYKTAGVQPAIPTLEDFLRPGAERPVNVVQARVIGGGPTVNNAIYFPVASSTIETWRAESGFPYSFAQVDAQQKRVIDDLGVSVGGQEVARAAGWRSRAFATAADQVFGAGASRSLQVGTHECSGCGGCNMGCRFGHKTGGLHGRGPSRKMSYLERARPRAAFATKLQAVRFETSAGRVRALVVRDLAAGGAERRIVADKFVLAAGPIASSQILHASGFGLTLPVGRGLSGNLVSPVYAVMPSEGDPALPQPGLQMCYFVDRGGHLLETWFHFPGSVAASIPGWFQENARVMREWRRLAGCGIVVPSAPSGRIDATGAVSLSISADELRRFRRGLADIAKVYFQAGASEVVPSTRTPASIKPSEAGDLKTAVAKRVRSSADLNVITAHPQGGNAIGSHGVLNDDFTVRGTDNLFVADASVFPSGCLVNPQLTVMALAHLAADAVAR